jgi:ABC transport system ATP-binding/permease protein
MGILSVRSLRKDFGIKEVLRDASFSLDTNDRVGLIGTNGSGKSTLLKMLAGLEPIDGGEIDVGNGIRIVYLPQQPEMSPEHTVLEQVFADSGEQMALVREYEAVSEQLAHGANDDKLLDRLAHLSERMEAAGAWDLETQAKIVLSQLGIEDFEVKVGTLSGGYRKRIAIAAALLSQPDVLLMDEPTNHLDANSVEWLQTYLARYQGTLVLITHDRYFLDRVTNRILEIDRADLYSYDGNYSYYLEKKAMAESSVASTQQKLKGVLRRELEWLQRGPKARSTKQKARIDRIHGMQALEFKETQGKVDISTVGRRIGKKVVELENITKVYDDRTLIDNFSYLFTPNDRIGIIGGNGAGKSTLMNIITGRLAPDSGSVDIGSTIHFGYFDQHSDDLEDAKYQNRRVIDYLKDVAELVKTSDGTVITASQMLERFLFSANQQYAPIGKLSGGEKRRLFLLKVLIGAPNVLILDEPTNDLDVQTLSVLEEYLEEFNGCVIVVSHDRYFLDRSVETIFELQPGGNIQQYPGNYSVYLDCKKAELTAAAPVSAAAAKTATSPQSSSASSVQTLTATPTIATSATPAKRKLSYKEKREFEQLEAHIPKLEAEKATVEKKLYQKTDGYSELETLTARLSQLTAEIEQATDRWLELAEYGA